MLVQSLQNNNPYGTHIYWRVFIETNHGDASFNLIAGIRFLDIDSVEIPATGGTAFGSDNDVDAEPDKAFDGDPNTYFASNANAGVNDYIGYEYSSVVGVAGVAVLTQTASNLTPDFPRMPKAVKLQYSDDGISYTDAFSDIIYNNLSNHEYILPLAAPGAGQHLGWRAFFVDNNGNASMNMEELEFRGSIGGADLVPAQTWNIGDSTGRVIGSSIESIGNLGFTVFDDSTGDWFASGNTNHWLGFMFESPISVAQVSLQAIVGANATQLARMPNNVHIDYTDDFVTWTQASTTDTLGTWTAGEVKTITVP